MAIVHLAYWLNIHAADTLAAAFQCNPYIEGCVSTSRAVRSGPGLVWFKAIMLPCAVLMALTWHSMGDRMERFDTQRPNLSRWTVWLGICGAIALVFYVLYLGSEGVVYSWLRRYGVVFFFGFTALAQLLSARFIWDVFQGALTWLAAFYIVLISLQWGIGVLSVFKRWMFEDPLLIERLQNVAEWLMIATMSAGFVLIGLLFGGARKPR